MLKKIEIQYKNCNKYEKENRLQKQGLHLLGVTACFRLSRLRSRLHSRFARSSGCRISQTSPTLFQSLQKNIWKLFFQINSNIVP